MLVVCSASACASAPERATREGVQSLAREIETTAAGEGREDDVLERYVAMAAARSPEVRAALERYRAAVHRIAPSRRLPDPMLELGLYVWNSDEGGAVTPAKLGLRQEFPWPTGPRAEAEAAIAEAMVQRRLVEALLLDVRAQIAEELYRLWLLERLRAIQAEQLEVLRGLSESTLGGLAAGTATLADRQQVELALARLEDTVAGLEVRAQMAEARLRALVSAAPDEALPRVSSLPSPALPGEDEEALRAAAKAHPYLASFEAGAEAADRAAKSRRAARLPGFSLGVEWMKMPGHMDTSAISPHVGLRLPIFQRSLAEGVRAAEAEASARRAEGEAATRRAEAELTEALLSLRDSLRRVTLHEDVLLPQAEAAYESVLGAYRASRASVAASLLSQRELLEIRMALEEARAEHAIAWRRLERVVGRAVTKAPVDRGARDDR